MNIKTLPTKIIGAIDYVFDGVTNNFAEKAFFTGIMSVLCSAFYFGWGSDLRKIDLRDFSEELDGLAVYENATIIKFPEQCDLGDNYYLISTNDRSKYEISASGDFGISNLTDQKRQDRLARNIGECMEDLSDQVAQGDFDFVDEMRVFDDVSFTEPAVINYMDEGESTLSKDVSSELSGSIEDRVEDLEAYQEDGDNSALYKVEFNKAVTAWDRYLDNRAERNGYFDGDGNILNKDQYQQYDYDAMDLGDFVNSIGYLSLAFFTAGIFMSDRSRAYTSRASRRREKIKNLNAVQGLDHTKF